MSCTMTDFAMSDAKKYVCFHCAKLIELFLLRSKVLTFIEPAAKGRLARL